VIRDPRSGIRDRDKNPGSATLHESYEIFPLRRETNNCNIHCAGSGPLSSHRSDEDGEDLPAGDEEHVRAGDVRPGRPQAGPGQGCPPEHEHQPAGRRREGGGAPRWWWRRQHAQQGRGGILILRASVSDPQLRIRIQHFRSMRIRIWIPGFDDLKFKQILKTKKFDNFLIKNCNLRFSMPP
jgi:hypothetical protein